MEINGQKYPDIFKEGMIIINFRRDNCVKNQQYSKLRKAIRFVNDIIEKNLKKKYKQLRINFIYKLI